MNTSSPENIRKAIARLPVQSSADVKRVRAQAVRMKIATLVEACDAELLVRPFDISQDKAIAFDRMAAQVEDLDLAAAIRVAFTTVLPPNQDEIEVLRWIATNPGGSYQDAERAHGKGDLALIIGHLVYERFGCFRRFMVPGDDQSSVLIHKDRAEGRVRYTLKPEAQAVFAEIEVI